MNAAIQRLHAVYCQETRFKCELTFGREYAWLAWLRQRKGVPFTEDDLRLVIGWLQRQMKVKGWSAAVLRFDRMICDPEKFEDDLNQAQADARVRTKAKAQAVDPGKAAVMHATGRQAVSDRPVRSAAQILADDRAFQELRAWRARENL